MGTFNTKAVLNADPRLIPDIADRICNEFVADGYEVKREDLISGGIDISLTKGGAFKAVLGMKTALKVKLQPEAGAINFDAGVGIFGQQVIPTLVMCSLPGRCCLPRFGEWCSSPNSTTRLWLPPVL